MGWRIKKNPRKDLTWEEKIRRSNSQRLYKMKLSAKKTGIDYHSPVTMINILDSMEKIKNDFPKLRDAEKKNRNRQSRKRVQRAS